MISVDIAIIGAGFAGVSAAWHLSKQGANNIVIFEREELPGMHASSQNASMVRRVEEDTVLSPHIIEGANFIAKAPNHWPRLLNQVGSLILFKESREKSIKNAVAFTENMSVETGIVDKKIAISKVPVLKGASFDKAVWTPVDGVVDINMLLWEYIKDAKKRGVRLEYRTDIVDIRKTESGFIIKTESGEYKAKKIVNATGAWASTVGKMAGALDIKLTPLRRHLYTTSVMKEVDPSWPFVWDIDDRYYFRPESGGLLLGPCDEEEVLPSVPSTSHKIREMLAEKLGKFCPALANVSIAREWAGLRTFAKDRRFVIGEDPKLKGFYWASGLGGFGVTSSYSVGKLAADAILNNGKNIPVELKPDRFVE